MRTWLLAMWAPGVAAATDVSGDVSGTWPPADNPYRVVGDLRVPPGEVLHLQPGVRVEFTAPPPYTTGQGRARKYRLVVQGGLDVQGSDADPVVFTRAEPTRASAGGGIRIENADHGCVIAHAIIEHQWADNGTHDSSPDDRGGGLFVRESTVSVLSSVFRHNEAGTGGGMYITSTTREVVVVDSLFTDNEAVGAGYNASGGAHLAYDGVGPARILGNVFVNGAYVRAWNGTPATEDTLPDTPASVSNYEGGGGVSLSGGGPLVWFAGNTVTANRSAKGPGIHLNRFGGQVVDNVVWGNLGGAHGEQLSAQTGNTAGGALSPTLRIASNVFEPPGIAVVWRNELESSTFAGTDDRDAVASPFVDAAAGDLTPTCTSPAVDSADATVPFFRATDQRGHVRVDVLTVPDTGAGTPTYADRGAIERAAQAIDSDRDGSCDDVDACTGDDTTGDADDDGACADIDCDDTDATVFPGAPERCDGLANDCAATAPPDEDADGDGDGDTICDGDCDDDDPAVHPGADEGCDGLDTDCDGGVARAELDADGDGSFECEECDDLDATVFPGAPEACDGVDTDCSGAPGTDEVDADGDGALACADCDDADADARPDWPELCDDGLDNDCDAAVDEDCPTPAEAPEQACGCAPAAPSSAGWPSVLAAAVLLRRRR